jgi:hypothetical protein
VERFFVTGPKAEAHWTQSDYHEHTEQGHGRVETRRAWISADLGACRENLGARDGQNVHKQLYSHV